MPYRDIQKRREVHNRWTKANPEKMREYARRHAARHKFMRRKNQPSKRAAQYGLTLEQHKAIYITQNGCCACCGAPTAYDIIRTDHDHVTGKVRGLLCNKCNLGIGHLGDNLTSVARAVAYLERAEHGD